MKSWMIVLTMLMVCTFFVGCSNAAPRHDTVHSAPAMIPPQIDGNIQSIEEGEPSYVVLNNVQETKPTQPSIRKSEEKIKLPKGRFISSNHWQSDGDTLDLFIGDDFVLMTQTGKMYDSSHYQNFAGIVKSVNDKEMVIQKVLYGTDAKGDSRAMQFTSDVVTIHFAPYTKASINGEGSRGQLSEIAEGDAVLLVLIGPPAEYIAAQITYFHSIRDAGWHME